MSKSAQSSGFLGLLRRGATDQKGVAAIEFALVLPIMIGLYVMLHETANGLRAARKVTMTARVMSDLASQPATISNANRTDIFAAANSIMRPFQSALASMRLTSVRFDGAGNAFVDWSATGGAGGYGALARCARADSGPVSIPSGLRTPNSSIVLAEVKYPYTPIIAYNIIGTINLEDKLHMRPRSSEFVQEQGGPTTTCPGWQP